MLSAFYVNLVSRISPSRLQYIVMSRFSEDIYLMCGEKPNILFMLCWKYISPCVMTVILLGFVFNVSMDGVTYFRYDKNIVSIGGI